MGDPGLEPGTSSLSVRSRECGQSRILAKCLQILISLKFLALADLRWLRVLVMPIACHFWPPAVGCWSPQARKEVARRSGPHVLSAAAPCSTQALEFGAKREPAVEARPEGGLAIPRAKLTAALPVRGRARDGPGDRSEGR